MESIDCERERDEVGLRILDTASTLFEQCGIEEVSMYQIAQTAGVGQGTLYRRYPNKGRLCFAVMQNKFNHFMADTDTALRKAKEGKESVQSRLSHLISMIVSLTQRNLAFCKTIMEAGKLEEVKENMFESPPFLFVVSKIQELLEEALADGELVQIDPVFAARTVACSFPPFLILHLHDLGYTSDEIVKQYTRTFIDPLFA